MPAPPPEPADALTRWSAAAARAGAAGLIVLGLGWELDWAPTGRGTLALKVLPLVLALPGLWRQRMYTCRWLSLWVWVYVAEGLVRMRGSPAPTPLLAGTEVALGVVLFAACATHVRWRLAADRRAAPAA